MKLTMPPLSHDPADYRSYRIIVDGHQVGHVLGRFRDWEALLWPVADAGGGQAGQESFIRLRLAYIRAELHRRLAEDGPWWKVPENPGGNA